MRMPGDVQSGVDPLCPMLTVAAVARRLGIAPSTLRTWDRRYGIGPSAHTAGAHRRYGPADLARLFAMRRLTLDGVAPVEAARIATSRPPDGEQLPSSATSGASARCEATAQVRGLARAAIALDSHEVGRLLRDAVRAHGVEQAWSLFVAPVLHSIGERWSATGQGVDVEHAFSENVLDVLRGVTATAQGVSGYRPVLLGCAEGDYHSLPLHALAAVLAEEGIGCRMLGGGIPREDLVAAVRRSGPQVVFLFARMAVGEGTEVLHLLPRQRPAPRVLLGGCGWDERQLPGGVVVVGSLSEALDQVLAAISR